MKKIISSMLALAMLVSLTACGNSANADPKVDDPATVVSEDTASKTEPEDISQKKFDGTTMKLFFLMGTDRGVPEEMAWFTKLSEQTGIKFEYERVTQRSDAVERFNLMLSSTEMPDIIMNGPSDAQISAAAKADKIYELTPLIDQYSPTWKEYFASDDYGRKVTTMLDGKIWSLPKVSDTGVNLRMRDEWLINMTWLKELNLKVPTNTDEFYTVLKAFKDNAGKGSIPANVIPWAARFNPASQDYTNGGFYELYNAFGAFSGQDFTSVDENGKIYFSATDEKMIAAIEYLHKLYKEGLIMPEIFTDKQTDLNAKKFAEPPVVGTYLHFANMDIEKVNYDALPPMTSPENSTPIYRSVENGKVARNYFTISKSCENVEAAMCLAETMAQLDWAMQGSYTMLGEGLVKNDDGTYFMPKGTDIELTNKNVPGVVFPMLISAERFSKLTFEEDKRADDVLKYYDKYCVPLNRLMPPVLMEDADLQKVNQIRTDLLSHITQTYASWIANGGVREGFSAFVEQCKGVGLEEYISLNQKALDAFNAS